MKRIILLFFLVFLTSYVYSSDFRRNNFGDSISEIKRNENSIGMYNEFDEDSYKRLIYYNVTIADKYIANLVYHFEYDVLVYGYYVVHSIYLGGETINFENEMYWIQAYNELCSSLDKLYGNTSDNLEKVTMAHVEAIFSGDIIFYEEWAADRKNIRILLDPGIDGVISSVKITYSDQNYSLPPVEIENGGL